jgi:superfamily I DNA and RNA helicase and helicase subunits-like protein
MGLIENNINSRIESWKKSLLDMTKRNRLLWYKPYRVGSLKLEEKYFDDHIESVLKEVDELAFNGKTWEFITETDQAEIIEDSNKDEEDVDENIKIIKERTKALSNIYKKVKQESEEKGLNIGYIAVGLLEWHEREDAQTKIKTPLILVPIKIEQDGRRTPFRISLNTDEQISLNPIIRKKFETDFDITLNDFPSDYDTNSTLSTYLSELRREISEKSNWTIKNDTIIDTFSFQNLAIWNDLDKNRDLVADNPFSRILAGGSLVDEGFSYESGEPDLEKVKSRDSLNIYEVDSSQQEAIYRAKKGESFVIQGPPGTGKSQTITNIIAEMLYLGKRVLFVSEKQAALDVVYHKLEKKNLSDFCLVLHNSKAKKQNVRDQIAKSLELSSKRNNVTDEALKIYDDLDKKRKSLNLYAEKLHEEFDDGTTPHMLIGEISKLRSAKDLVFDMPKDFNWGADYNTEIADLFYAVDEYGKSFIDNTNHFTDNYWKYYQGELGNTTRREVQEKIGNINESTFAEKINALDLKNISSTSKELFNLLDLIPFSQSEHRDLEKSVENILTAQSQVKEINQKIKDLEKDNSETKTKILENFSQDFMALDNPNDYYKKLVNKYNLFFSRFSSGYKVLVSKLNACSLRKMKYNDYVDSLNMLISYNTNMATITGYEKDISSLNLKIKTAFEKLVSSAESKKTEMLLLLEKLDFDSLPDYQHYIETRAELLDKYKLDDFVAKTEDSGMTCGMTYNSNEIADIFKKRFLILSLEMTDFDRKYSRYNHTAHDSDVNMFREYDKKILKISAARIRCELSSKMPNFSLFTNQAHGGEIQLLQRELKKKTRLMPTRTLIKSLPIVLPALKPCMMMSPLTVSSYFGTNPNWKFDVVIFDEASQVKPEYAITSIIRGKQVIVAGDSKQMPPTSFFDSMDDDEYSEENPQIDNLESILDEMSAAFPDVYLNWHYRSKDESLIMFSNNKFYNSRLATFPASSVGGNLGTSFVYCENGIWESKGGNQPEAEMVAEIVLEHIKNQPERSLGIVTFGKSQENTINEAIDKLRDIHPECEFFFNENNTEPFFVKNLERVQGDERDRIIISCGYGKDKNGSFAMRFGPLAMTGGERRLNVAISRARRAMTIVSSFRANEVRGTESNPQRRLIRDFIDYAEHGISALLGDGQKGEDYAPTFDSSFEEDVYNVLINNGYRLRTQVGSSGYKIDIAVLHPEIDGRYILAIECDGAAYHSSRTARDRDILRQKILESQGWKFHRIWSTDWYHDNANSQKRLFSAIQNAIDNYSKDEPEKSNIVDDQVDIKDEDEDELIIETRSEDIEVILTKIYSSWTTALRKTYGMGSYRRNGWSNNDGWDSLYVMEHYDHIQKIIEEVLPYKNGFAPEDIFREINTRVFKKGRYSSQADRIYKNHLKRGFIDTGKIEIVDGSVRIK